ncbi:GNAT family N-acetyltransferase [Rhizobium binxianense]
MAREILRTERLTLREITGEDLPLFERIFGDPSCMRHYPATKDAAETRAFLDRLAFDSYGRDGFGLWAVVDRRSGALLGDCGITLQETPKGPEPEIGYHLWRDFWGKGYATEAAIACRDHALGALGLPRIVSIVALDNLASQKVAGRVHQRRERFSKRNAAGEEVERYLYVTEKGLGG